MCSEKEESVISKATGHYFVLQWVFSALLAHATVYFLFNPSCNSPYMWLASKGWKRVLSSLQTLEGTLGLKLGQNVKDSLQSHMLQ